MRWYCEYCDGYCELLALTNKSPPKCPYDLDECDWIWKMEDEV